jgi:F-type H+-transporting ATPase subunit b
MMKTTMALIAAEGHTAPPLVDLDNTVFIQFGIFMVLLLVLNRLVFRPYLALLRERHENIDGAKEEAQRANCDAEQALLTYEEQIMKARKDASASRLRHREEGEMKASEVLAEARKEGEAKLQATRLKINKSAQAATLALRTRADQIASDVAAKLLGRRVS